MRVWAVSNITWGSKVRVNPGFVNRSSLTSDLEAAALPLGSMSVKAGH